MAVACHPGEPGITHLFGQRVSKSFFDSEDSLIHGFMLSQEPNPFIGLSKNQSSRNLKSRPWVHCMPSSRPVFLLTSSKSRTETVVSSKAVSIVKRGNTGTNMSQPSSNPRP